MEAWSLGIVHEHMVEEMEPTQEYKYKKKDLILEFEINKNLVEGSSWRESIPNNDSTVTI